jgi:hypothetical protein
MLRITQCKWTILHLLGLRHCLVQCLTMLIERCPTTWNHHHHHHDPSVANRGQDMPTWPTNNRCPRWWVMMRLCRLRSDRPRVRRRTSPLPRELQYPHRAKSKHMWRLWVWVWGMKFVCWLSTNAVGPTVIQRLVQYAILCGLAK